MHGNCHKHMILKSEGLFRAANLPAYAGMVKAYETALVEGALHADNAGPPLEIIVKHRVLGCEVDEDRWVLCNFASLNHYYDPVTDAGLNLQDSWGSLEVLLETVQVFLFGGLYCADLSAEPDLDFIHPYPSAAAECQLHYDRALQRWQHGDSHGAFFELGWAAHYITDACTSPHTVSDRFIGHGEYEDRAEICFGTGQYTMNSVGQFPKAWGQARTPYEFVRLAARQTRTELQHYTDGEDAWDEGLLCALPRAEKLTACLIAKFLTAIDVNTTCPPLNVSVVNARNSVGIAGALVFHRAENSAQWQRVRTDAQGECTLHLKEGTRYKFRPALPGYTFIGKHSADKIRDIPELTPKVSPVEFRLENPLLGSPSLVLALEPSAMQIATIAIPAALERPALWNARLGPLPDHIERRLRHILVSVEAKGTGEGEEISVVQGDPSGRLIAIHVHDVFDLQTLQKASPLSGRLRHFDPARDRALIGRIGTAPRLDQLPANAIAAFQPIVARTEKHTTRDPQGNTTLVARPSHARLQHTEALGRSGLMLVPAEDLYDVKVSIVTGPGHVGHGMAPIAPATFRTNESGTTVFRVTGGGQIGELRLRIEVSTIGAAGMAGSVLTTKDISVWVWPDQTGGMDRAPLLAPTIGRGRALPPA